MDDLEAFAETHGLHIAAIRDIIRYHMRHGKLAVRRVAEANMPTKYGTFRIIAYESDASSDTHIALVKGDVDERVDPSPCSCAFTANASPATPSVPCAATAAISLPPPSCR